MSIDPKRPVLLVEDYLEMRGTLRMCLEELGFTQIFEAENVQAAKSLLTVREYGLIIADWQMPDLSGIDLLRVVRASFVHREVPFVLVTAHASRELVQEALTLKVFGFIAKPFDLQTLAKTLKIPL